MLLSHERSVKKEDMDRAELDAFLRQITPREQFYLDNPGAPSPRFKTMEHRTVRGRDVLYFHLQELPNDEIHLRKDSRFTDVPYYMHSNININYIYDGHCDYLIDDKPITLYKGDVCIFDLGVVRRKLTLGPSDIVINLNMTNEFFGDSFFHKAGRQNLFSDFMVHVLSTGSTTTHDHYLIFRAGNNPEIARLFEQLLIEYYGDAPYRKQMIQGYFDLIFLQLLRLHQEDSNNQLVQIATTHSQNVLNILYYIEGHAVDCTLLDLATQFGYHPKYISARLKEVTGMSYKQLQTRERLKLVCCQLLQTDNSIQEIAHSCGFNNMTAFYRIFEEQLGQSPNKFRNKK